MRINLVLISLLYSFISSAQEVRPYITSNIKPLSDIIDVQPESEIEEVHKLKSARIALMDYSLIRKDFPEIAHLSNSEIDDIILNQVNYTSKPQVLQNKVNTDIPITEKKRKAHRPPEYGRALVYEFDYNKKNIGLIDVKGAGGLAPSHASHSNGLMSLGEALREFSYEKMITNVIDHAGIKNKVVGSYGVIYAGFDIIFKDGSRVPAGLYLRQAHRRYTKEENKFVDSKKYGPKPPPRGNGWMTDVWRNKYEKLLDQYGIWANKNYQGTIHNELFDFGHYIVRKDLHHAKYKLQIPFEQWGFDRNESEEIAPKDDRWKFSKRDRPWLWSHDTAKAFASGKASRHHVWLNHYNLLHPVQEKLEKVERTYTNSSRLGFTIKSCQKRLDTRGK